jgi:hypothetical protein
MIGFNVTKRRDLPSTTRSDGDRFFDNLVCIRKKCYHYLIFTRLWCIGQGIIWPLYRICFTSDEFINPSHELILSIAFTLSVGNFGMQCCNNLTYTVQTLCTCIFLCRLRGVTRVECTPPPLVYIRIILGRDKVYQCYVENTSLSKVYLIHTTCGSWNFTRLYLIACHYTHGFLFILGLVVTVGIELGTFWILCWYTDRYNNNKSADIIAVTRRRK